MVVRRNRTKNVPCAHKITVPNEALLPKCWAKKLDFSCTILQLYRKCIHVFKMSNWKMALQTGSALEADLSPHGSIRSAGTREYRWLMLSSWLGTDRFGGKSQWRYATADSFASWWWWWLQTAVSASHYDILNPEFFGPQVVKNMTAVSTRPVIIHHTVFYTVFQKNFALWVFTFTQSDVDQF